MPTALKGLNAKLKVDYRSACPASSNRKIAESLKTRKVRQKKFTNRLKPKYNDLGEEVGV